MSTSEEIQGFDPKHDDANTPNGGKVKRMYEKLVGRGEDDAAEEMRHADTVSEQLRLAQQHPEFDPKYDEFRTTSKGEIKRVYEWLIEHGHDDDAESLRGIDTVTQQQDRVSELKKQYPLKRR